MPDAIENTEQAPIKYSPDDECYACKVQGKNWFTDKGRGSMKLTFVTVDNIEYPSCWGCLSLIKTIIAANKRVDNLIAEIDNSLEELDRIYYT